MHEAAWEVFRPALSRGPAFCGLGEPAISRSTDTFSGWHALSFVFSRSRSVRTTSKHRLVMAPLTRMRAERPSLAPRPLNAEYYAQRATPAD